MLRMQGIGAGVKGVVLGWARVSEGAGCEVHSVWQHVVCVWGLWSSHAAVGAGEKW
jgi:hypothetical protein